MIQNNTRETNERDSKQYTRDQREGFKTILRILNKRAHVSGRCLVGGIVPGGIHTTWTSGTASGHMCHCRMGTPTKCLRLHDEVCLRLRD